MIRNSLLMTAIWALFIFTSSAQDREILDSGGALSELQASYDVTHYGLDLNVDADNQAIAGTLSLTADVLNPMSVLEVDLDTMLEISRVFLSDGSGELEFERSIGIVHIALDRAYSEGESVAVSIDYSGQPRVAPMPPWRGGFTWGVTPTGDHFIATSCQGEGADVWWPCKDHVSDEPDSMDLYITVPSGLYAACNGVLQETSEADTTVTYHWHISEPINIYTVALNIAPYVVLEETYTSVTSEEFPFIFYVLPENVEKGKAIMPEFMDHMRFFEELLGPYPFRSEKYGVVQTPHLGMEHQTIIAYGANFDNAAMLGRDFGFDALHHHELAHEWWGNLVTNSSWEDAWIHEGFGSYMQALYVEKLSGEEGYFNYMRFSRMFPGVQPVAPRETLTADQAFAAPIYTKGAWILHTLRTYIGDEAFFKSLRDMIYPDETYATATDGSQCRFVDTDDFQMIAEQNSGKDLEWFFDLYLRQAELPVLVVHRISSKKVKLLWRMPIDVEMPIPVEIRVGDKEMSEVIPADGLVIKVKEDEKLTADPRKSILCDILD